jgi:16S rRNA (cytosine967-C5)-methyltransferase
MTPGARLAAAAEILDQVLQGRSAADRALQAWGRAHRFAGAKDRAAIAGRVYAVLRRLGECEAVLGRQDGRSLVLASLAVCDHLPVAEAARLAADGTHAPGALTRDEESRLAAHVPGRRDTLLNIPGWLVPRLKHAFGDSLVAEVEALDERAPLDLRVNTLKARRDDVMAELVTAGLSPSPCAQAPDGIRLEPGSDARITGLACYLEGRVEIQDESSQLATRFAAPTPGETVVDLASGAGGKALAMAALMQDRGRVIACDVSIERLMALGPRRARSGASIIAIAGDPYGERLAGLVPDGADLVFIDAPCSGSGTWRRNPEARWTLNAARLEGYLEAQQQLLERAAALVAPQGRIVHAVCSVLAEEGPEQVHAFCSRHPDWRIARTLRLTPASTGTDGFFAAELRRQ